MRERRPKDCKREITSGAPKGPVLPQRRVATDRRLSTRLVELQFDGTGERATAAGAAIYHENYLVWDRYDLDPLTALRRAENPTLMMLATNKRLASGERIASAASRLWLMQYLLPSLTFALFACGSSSTPEDDASVDARSDSEDAGQDAPVNLDASLPPSPTGWNPGFDLAPEIGWRDSTEPVCPEFVGGVAGFDLHVDDRGVFVLASIFNNAFDLNHPRDPYGTPLPSGSVILHNAGDQWSVYHRESEYDRHPTALHGLDGGTLWTLGGRCGIVRVTEANSYCDLTRETHIMYAFNDNILFASTFDRQLMVRQMPDRWSDPTPLTVMEAPLSERQLTAAEDGAPVGIWGDDLGYIYLTSQRLFTLDRHLIYYPGAPEPSGQFSSLQVDSRNRLTLGSVGMVAQLDGETWRVHPIPSEQPLVATASSADGETYYITRGQFGRLRTDGTTEIIADTDLPGVEFAAIAVHRSDVFLAIKDTRYLRHQCGSTFMVYYDGARLRRF